jgi:hypothetical protein
LRLRGFLARARAFLGAGRAFFLKTLIAFAFFPALRGCFVFDLRFALTILTSSSPKGCRAGKKGAILPQSASQDLWAFS